MEVTRIATEPHATFDDRFARAAASAAWDVVYVSHVFFSSGYALDHLSRVVDAVKQRETFIVLDGYHAFSAISVDLSRVHDRVFYVAGGYKYAMSGEGACFLHAPPGYGERPRDTGWYAAFGALAHAQHPGRVPYAPGGARFLGATFDPTALYRFNAVMDLLERLGLDGERIHAHAMRLEERFLAELRSAPCALDETQLVVPLSEPRRGNFLTFATPRAQDLYARLLAANIVTDVQGDRLRVGFGLYHDDDDVVRGVARIRAALGG
jgi:selenocysteine lyase/cysteine desulfurase